MHPKNHHKLAAPIAKKLRLAWLGWLCWVLFVYPAATAWAGASFISGVLACALALTPALIATPIIWRATQAMALIWVALVMLIYLGVAGVMLTMRVYEGAPWVVSVSLGVEFLWILTINILLFILLKRLPAAHKTV